jgi:hypothetical protein
MLTLLLFMHRIALYTSYFALYNYVHLFYIRVDHVELKTENQVEQV